GLSEIIDVSTTPVLNLQGDLNNQGTIYLLSTNPLMHQVTIDADNIVDGTGAVITTVLPSAGVPGYGSAVSNLSLTLVATHDIVNDGGIRTDGGAITITAGGTFSSHAIVSSSGLEPGRSAGNITMIAVSIIIDQDVLMVGADGIDGPNGKNPGQA